MAACLSGSLKWRVLLGTDFDTEECEESALCEFSVAAGVENKTALDSKLFSMLSET